MVYGVSTLDFQVVEADKYPFSDSYHRPQVYLHD